MANLLILLLESEEDLLKGKKQSNIKVICSNNDEEHIKEINKKFTRLVAELVRNGEIK